MKQLRVLILEDYESDALLLLRELRRGGYELDYAIVDNAGDMERALNERDLDIILSDYSMQGFNAPTALSILKRYDLDIPFIIISGTVGEDVAVAAMKAGAQDFFSKDKLQRLIPAVEREVRDAGERRKRRLAEKLFRQAEERFGIAFEVSPVGIVISRLSDGRAVDVNPRFIEIFGYSREEIIGKTGTELNLWDNPYHRDHFIEALQQKPTIQNIEVKFRRQSGEEGYGLLSGALVELYEEPGILTMVHDITEHKIAEIALENSEKQFRLIAENVSDLITRNSLEGVILYASPSCRALLGYEPEELIGKSAFEFFHPDDLDEINKSFSYILENDDMYTVAYRTQRKDGSYIWFETISRTLRDPETNNVTEIYTTSRDITYRKKALDEEHARRILGEALYDTTSALLSGEFGLDELLSHILHYAVSLIPCDAATLMEVKEGIAYVISCRGYEQENIDAILNFTMDVNQTKNLRLMAESRKPLVIADTKTFPGWRTDKISQLAKIRANLAAPIFIRDQLFGFINLDSFTPDHFTQEHADQLAILTGQASIAIHNARLYEQIQQYTNRLRILHGIDRAILRADQPQTIAQAVIEQLQSLHNYHSTTMTIYDLDRKQQTILASTKPIPTLIGKTLPLHHPKLIESLQHNQIYVTNDLQKVEQLTQFEEVLLTQGIRSYACVPLLTGDKLIGSINYRSEIPHAFSSASFDISREVSAQLAIAIENARLLEVEKRRNGELTAIHQASLQLTSILDLETVLNTILDYAILLVAASDAHIFLYDGDHLTFGAAHWDGKRQTEPLAEPRPDGLTHHVAQTGKRHIVTDMSNHPVYKNSAWSGTIIGLPLTVAGQTSGVMNLAFLQAHIFDEHEIRLLELLADQAAIAINNAQLYEQIQSHAIELEQRVIERTQQLQRSKDRVEAILNSNNDAIILANMNGLIYQTNPGFNQEFGYEPDALFHHHIGELFDAEFSQQFDTAFQEVIQAEISKRIEVVARRQDDSTFPVDALISPFSEDGGLGVICSLRNITLQKQIESELRLSLEKEKELNALKTQFTSIVSHEFRTPLAVILSSSELLYNYHDRLTPERQKTKLHQIAQQVQRLTKLMDDVLMITRAESVGFEFKPRENNIVELCKSIIEELQVRNDKDIPIHFEFKGNYQTVIMDEFLFSHIVQNLVSNAIKYSTTDGDVEISLACTENEAILQIKDHGIGIPKDHQAKLFESFQRASNVGQIQGTGIGMTIVKHAVDAHEGTIEFESTEGIGTTFVVKIPIR